MPSEITLNFIDENGQERQIVVDANPFTIGRQDGNNLVIHDSSLSRRHALITSFSDVAQISDCGSQNGTYLNGQRLTSAAVLKNGDQITIGQDCKIRVQLVPKVVPTQPVFAPTTNYSAHSTPQPAPAPAPSINSAINFDLPKLSPALIAGLATVVILLFAGGMIGLMAWKNSKPKADEQQQEVVFTDTPVRPQSTEIPTTTTTSTSTTEPPIASSGSDQFEKSLVQAIRYISNDNDYPFPQPVMAEVKRRATQYATPTFANTLRSMAARSDETIASIRAQGIKKPALPIYMGLAETNGGQAGDPLAVARQMVPEVQFLRGHFGSEFADPTLMLVAAHKVPGGNKKSHPLLEPLRRLVRNPQTDRNVWFLREKGALNDAAYDYVLRFLAYAAIAQNPRQFGLDAPALVF